MKLIRNVLLAHGSNFKTVNVLFDENIINVSTNPIETELIQEEFDFSGCIIIPGAVDMHTHILSGSEDDTDNLRKASISAICGGYTTLGDMSFINEKPIFRAKDLNYYKKVIDDAAFCDVALWGHCDFSKYPYHIDFINEIWSEGIVGLILMHPSPGNKIEEMGYNDIMDLFDNIYDSDVSFAFQGYDIDEPSTKENSVDRFIEQRLVSIRKILRRIQDNPLHFVRICDRTTIEMLNIAFRRSDMTYAIPIHWLIQIINQFGITGFKRDDPFSEYVKLLFDSMKNGKLYTITNETGPIFKSKDTLSEIAYNGESIEYLKWTVPWVFSELWKKNKVSIQSCIRMVSENPAKRLGLFPQKGSIEKGSHADITIIDPDTSISSNLTDSQGDKIHLSCSIKATFLRGNLINKITSRSKPNGQFIKRSSTTRRKLSSSNW